MCKKQHAEQIASRVYTLDKKYYFDIIVNVVKTQ